MDQVTTGAAPDDEELTRFGYRQQFARSLRHFESFAVAFSFISITTGIFTTYLFALTTGGTRSIWTWPIVIVGQALVALVYGALSVRVPLSGYSYQWASRLASPHIGWWFGWMSFAFLTIVTVSVDFSMARDRRLPGHQLLHQVPRATGGPPWATILAAVLGAAIALALRTHTAALTTLFTASTIMPALLYAGTVLLYIVTSRRRGWERARARRPARSGNMNFRSWPER